MSDLFVNWKLLSNNKKLYSLCDSQKVLAELGVWSLSHERNILFGLKNNSTNASNLFKFIITVTKNYDNLYAVPNEKGSQIWSALRWNHKYVNISIADKKTFFEKISYRLFFHKYLFFNLFFILKPSDRKSLFINRKIFYKGNLPSVILVDTF